MLKIPVVSRIHTRAALSARRVHYKGSNLAAAALLFVIIFAITISPASASTAIGYWSFDQGTGTTVTDLSGNGNNGTLINRPTWSPGKFGYGLSFNGIDQYVEIAHSDSLNITRELTLSAWIHKQAEANSLLSEPEFDVIASKGWAPDPGGSWTLAWDKRANDLVFCVRNRSNDGYNCVFFNYGALTHDWHHVSAQFNHGKISLYVNGLLVAGPVSLGSTNLMSNSENVRIGAVSENSHKLLQTWDGTIDEVQIYNKALSDTEIKALYQKGGSHTSSGSLVTSSNFLSQTNTATTSRSDNRTTATPVITPNGGSFTSTVSVVLSSNTPGASIYYTTNGSAPTQSSTQYKGPFILASNAVVKAKAFKNNSTPSSEVSAWFSMDQQFDFSLANSGDKATTKGSSTQNNISAALKSGKSKPISYAVSGLPNGANASFATTSCNPTCSTVLTLAMSASTPAGTFPIVVTGSDGAISRSTSFNLTVSDLPTAATPTINPNSGSYTGAVSVTMTTATVGAVIRYTTDGTIPTQLSKLYTGAITLSGSATVKAVAFLSGYNSSGVASASFTIVQPFDFSLTNSANKSVTAGASVTNSIAASLLSGATQPVTFGISGLPSGATASFGSASCTPTCSTVVNITTSGSTPTGTFSVVISATGGGITRSTTFTLTVAAATVASTVATPTITPNGGSFANSASVTLATVTSGASIYYTTNGSSPTQSSTLYTGAITLTTTAVVKAKAFKSGYNPSAEVSASFMSDLVAYWKFDEGTGTTIADYSGNGNTGTLVNGPQWATGVVGKALYFDGTNKQVTVLNSDSLNPTSAFTVSAWVNPAGTSADFRSVLVKNYKYYLYSSVAGYCGNGSPLGGFEVDSNQTICDSVPVPANTWTHLGISYDGSTLAFYRNGAAVATTAASGTLLPSTGVLQIGASEYGEFFKGLIDEVRVYRRALSIAEVQAIYKQNAPPAPSFDFALSNSGATSLTAGSSATNSITPSLTAGASQPVSFSVSGLPSGATASFSSPSCTPTCSTVLTINTSGATSTGTYPITVSATGGGMTKTTSFTLSITASVLLTVATPTITPNGGTFSGFVSVAMQTTTSGASIYYTTDGSTPTQSSSLYTGAMTLTSSATVNAKAFKSGSNPSVVAAAAFTNTSSGTTYYVAKTGSDSNSCNQARNSSTPKLTITAALACIGSAGTQSGAGYTVQVASGTYNETLVDKIPSGTSWSAPFTLKSATPLSATLRPSTNGSIIGINTTGQYIVVDGFTIDGQAQSDGCGICLSGFKFGDIHHIRITNNEIRNMGSDGITGGKAWNLEVINNKIHGGRDVCGGSPGGYCHAMYVVTANSVIERNTIYNWPVGYGLHFYNNYGGSGMDNNIVRYNVLYNVATQSGQAAILASGSNMHVYGNIVYSSGSGIWATQGGSNIYVYNNSVYGNTTYGILNTSVSNMIVKNNIAYMNSRDIVDDASITTKSHNLLGVNPLFVDPASANFNLRSGSPAIGAGTCTISTSIPLMCSGETCDIGAYQYGGGLILSH